MNNPPKTNTEILWEIVEKYSKNMSNEIGSALAEVLSDKLEDIDFQKDMNDISIMEYVIQTYLKKASTTLEELCIEIAKVLKTKINDEFESNKNK